MSRTFKCTCKDGYHELDTTFPVWDYIARTIDELGEEIPVQVLGGTDEYLVPRIYIAIHGLKAVDLPRLGFKKK